MKKVLSFTLISSDANALNVNIDANTQRTKYMIVLFSFSSPFLFVV